MTIEKKKKAQRAAQVTEADTSAKDALAVEEVAGADEPAPSNATTSRRNFIAGLAVGAVVVGAPAAVVASRRNDGDSNGGGGDPVASDGSDPLAGEAPSPEAATRRSTALQIRQQAALLAAAIELPAHEPNSDERQDIGYALNFTKGLPHDYETGLVARTSDYDQFVRAAEEGTPQAFLDTPLGPDEGFRNAPNDAPLRAWESQAIGLVYDLIGPDMQAVTMPPAPTAGSNELIGEMAEVYGQAVLRDELLSNLRFDGSTTDAQERVIEGLNEIPWFDASVPPTGLSAEARLRRRSGLNAQTAFRGNAPGERIGPYLSQLLLVGAARADGSRSIVDGFVQYGAQSISQRVRQAAPIDFMTSWDDWFDVQNGLAPPAPQIFEGPDRFITSGRDLATYVHTDALYQPYFNACLVLFGLGVPLDEGMPFTDSDREDHQQGFVLFAPNHVFALLAEVCMRALKTVKYQKFNVHRRLRPEALAARIERADVLGIEEISTMAQALSSTSIADDIRAMTEQASSTASMLLPMAFAEGSPMHPSYGAGHGTVAGACTTIIKALFNHNHPVAVTGNPGSAFVASRDGSFLEQVRVLDDEGELAQLTVEGEVNKLAANISIGRNWAGVHYFSDYWESVLLGEAIAIQILREHMLTTSIDFTLTVPTFEGNSIVLST